MMKGMGRTAHSKVTGHNPCWITFGTSKFYKDFGLVFAQAFRYYITGLIIGYFLLLAFKKCYRTWISPDECPDSDEYDRIEDPIEEIRTFQNKNRQQRGDEEGKERTPKKRRRSHSTKHPEGATLEYDTLPDDLDGDTPMEYWKECIDKFGFLVVDPSNPTAPYELDNDAGNASISSLASDPRTNKSSSTTDFNINAKRITSSLQVRFNSLVGRDHDSCVDVRDHKAYKKLSRIHQNKKLDTSDLSKIRTDGKRVASDDSKSFDPFLKNDLILAEKDQVRRPGSPHCMDSSLIPGQKVKKGAMIVVRLRDNQLSSCDVFEGEKEFLSALKSRSRIKSHSNQRASTGSRCSQEDEKSLKDSVADITLSENIYESTMFSKNLFSYTNPETSNKNPKISAKKSFGMPEIWGKRSRDLKISSKPCKAVNINKVVQPDETSKRRCFKYKRPSKKRPKNYEASSKKEKDSVLRPFLPEGQKKNPFATEGVTPAWLQDEKYDEPIMKDDYRIDVNKSANGLNFMSKGMSPEKPHDVYVKIKERGPEAFIHSRGTSEPEISKSKNTISPYFTDTDSVNNGELLGNVNVPTAKNSQEYPNSLTSKRSLEYIYATYSDISTASELDEWNIPSSSKKSMALSKNKNEPSALDLNDSSNKTNRGQFWKLFNSRTLTKEK